jgi:hypothetical protein
MTLGFTRSGHPVLRPVEEKPDKSAFDGWSRGDHEDAAHILTEHSEREPDKEIASWCARRAHFHDKASKKERRSSRGVAVRGAAETVVRSRRR